NKKVVNDSYTHDLSQLLKIANLHQILIADAKNDVSLEINWSVVKDWSEQFRYDNNISKAMAEQLFDAVGDQNSGVLK
ncbi:DNA-binding protein, partial [Escherichia coli]|nr:DNA-binding protein [Escherichia coli]